MRSAIFYGSPTKLTNAHKPVHHLSNPHPPNGGKAQTEYYVRMDTFNGDCVGALEKAKPMDGETVLNTVDL